jgi:hypothetical protein
VIEAREFDEKQKGAIQKVHKPVVSTSPCIMRYVKPFVQHLPGELRLISIALAIHVLAGVASVALSKLLLRL